MSEGERPPSTATTQEQTPTRSPGKIKQLAKRAGAALTAGALAGSLGVAALRGDQTPVLAEPTPNQSSQSSEVVKVSTGTTAPPAPKKPSSG